MLSGTEPQRDAGLAIDLELGQYRGESRFTTWACLLAARRSPAQCDREALT